MRVVLFLLFLGCQVQAALAAGKIVLPLHFENNIPVVSLSIGEKNVPFILDTGAADGVYLDKATEQTIPGATRTGKVVKSLDLGGVVAENYEIAIPDLVVNGMHFTQLSGRTLTPWGPGKDGPGAPPKIPVLGLRFFDHKKVLFDFAAKQVTIWDAGAEPPGEIATWTSVPFERVAEGVVVPLAGKAGNYRIALDSASTISLVNRLNIKPTDIDAACQSNPTASGQCGLLNVSLPGTTGIALHPVDFPERFHADGMVGREFFDQFRVFLDSAAPVLRVMQNDHP